uniref:Uncharacterized protein n=1 Tax=Glossina austeni TaxID=7395 RepID=A0A1A9UN01_GLOAU
MLIRQLHVIYILTCELNAIVIVIVTAAVVLGAQAKVTEPSTTGGFSIAYCSIILQHSSILSSLRLTKQNGASMRYLALNCLNRMRWGKPEAIRLTVSNTCNDRICLTTHMRSKQPAPSEELLRMQRIKCGRACTRLSTSIYATQATLPAISYSEIKLSFSPVHQRIAHFLKAKRPPTLAPHPRKVCLKYPNMSSRLENAKHRLARFDLHHHTANNKSQGVCKSDKTFWMMDKLLR